MDKIEFTLYNPDGTVHHHGMNRDVVDENTWVYSAWFRNNEEYYVIEKPIPGYYAYYENVGIYADVKDRCYNGGTIINRKVPDTGDATPIIFLISGLLGSMAGLILILRNRKMRAK